MTDRHRHSFWRPHLDYIKAMRARGWTDATIAGALNAPPLCLDVTKDQICSVRRWHGIGRPPRNNKVKLKRAINSLPAPNSDLTKMRRRISRAEELWIDRLDDRMFNKGDEGRGAVA